MVPPVVYGFKIMKDTHQANGGKPLLTGFDSTETCH